MGGGRFTGGGHGQASSSLRHHINLLVSQNICTLPTEEIMTSKLLFYFSFE